MQRSMYISQLVPNTQSVVPIAIFNCFFLLYRTAKQPVITMGFLKHI